MRAAVSPAVARSYVHHSRGTASPVPDQQRRSPQVRKDNRGSVAGVVLPQVCGVAFHAADQAVEAKAEFLGERHGGECARGPGEGRVHVCIQVAVERGELGGRGRVGRSGTVLLDGKADDIVADGGERACGEVGGKSAVEERVQDALALGEAVGADGDLGHERGG